MCTWEDAWSLHTCMSACKHQAHSNMKGWEMARWLRAVASQASGPDSDLSTHIRSWVWLCTYKCLLSQCCHGQHKCTLRAFRPVCLDEQMSSKANDKSHVKGIRQRVLEQTPHLLLWFPCAQAYVCMNTQHNIPHTVFIPLENWRQESEVQGEPWVA